MFAIYIKRRAGDGLSIGKFDLCQILESTKGTVEMKETGLLKNSV